MKLVYYRATDPAGRPSANFGDDLNLWLWPKVLPRYLLEGEPTSLLYGIGTLLGPDMPREPKVILGSGTAQRTPIKVDDSWQVVFVRGPVTCQVLSIPETYAVTDPAALVSRHANVVRRPKVLAWMPHFWQMYEHADLYRATCDRAGVKLIDPRQSPESVFEQLADVELLLAGAMHAAIVGDALGIPWVSCHVGRVTQPLKWLDFTSSLEMDVTHHAGGVLTLAMRRAGTLCPSVLLERRLASFLKACARQRPNLSDRGVFESRVVEIEKRLARFVATQESAAGG